MVGDMLENGNRNLTMLRTPGFLVLLSIGILLVIKLPHLSLPLYWDEAFPYSYAIWYMYENGLSILPDAIPADLSTGHPLLFYFSAAAWMKVFGTSLLAMNLFPLLLSVLLQLATFGFCRTFFTPEIGGWSCLLMTLQGVFLAQSTFLLPEVLLALLTITTLWTYLRGRKVLFVLSGILLLFTKETGIVLFGVLGLMELFQFIMSKEKNRIDFIRKASFLIGPIAVIFCFYLLQKFMLGWFLFPRHVGFMSFDPSIYLGKLENYGASLFVYDGRNMLTLLLMIGMVFFKIKRRELSEKKKQVMGIMGLFIFSFLVMSAANFYSPRYILCVYPFFVILVVTFLLRGLPKWWGQAALVIALSSISFYSLTKTNDDDHNLGYVDAVRVQREAIQFCQENNFEERRIYASYLMVKNMAHKYPGYLGDKGSPFVYLSSEANAETEIFVFTSGVSSDGDEELKKQYGLTLLKKFGSNKSWSEVYGVGGE